MLVHQQDSSRDTSSNPSVVALYAFIPSIIVIFLCAFYWYADLQADKTTKTTPGVITQAQSRLYRYRYSVDGSEYTGEEIIKVGGELFAGEEIRVTYRPEEPSASTLLPPFGATDSRPVPMILAALIGLYLYFRLRSFLLQRRVANPYDTI